MGRPVALDIRLTAVFLGLSALVALAPLPLGSARPLAWDLLALGVALLLIAVVLLRRHEIAPLHRDVAIPAALIFIAFCFVLIQMSRWTPAAWQNPLWSEASDALRAPVRGSIALDRTAALSGLLRLMLYAGVFYLAVVVGRDGARAAAAVQLVFAAGCAYAAYGLLVYWSGNRTVLWFPKWAYFDDLSGPFVNKNSFATYLGIALLAALVRIVTIANDLPNYRGDFPAWLNKVLAVLSRRIGILLGAFVIATALILTHSRAGLVATIGGAAALLAAIAMAPSLGRARRAGWLAVPIVAVVVGFAISGGTTFAEILDLGKDAPERLEVYRLTLQAIGDYPFQGTGLNSFASIFPVYRTAAVHGYFDLAHNDYLQNLLELGVPAALCLFAAVAWLIGLCIRGIRVRRRDALYPCLGFAASVLVALHSTVDFSLQIPAVTISYLYLLGIGVAQSRSSQDRSAEASSASR